MAIDEMGIYIMGINWKLDSSAVFSFVIDWLQSPVTIFFSYNRFNNPLKQNQSNVKTIKAGH